MKILVTGGSGFIGTNFIDFLLGKEIDFINLDINCPKKASHAPYWQQCDILNLELCLGLFREFRPTHIVHLAARTDTTSNDLRGYRVNTEGTENILHCIGSTPSSQRVIITSSQFVFAPPGVPESDEHFNPIGAYGMSKVISERATRSAALNCVWTITRPTNIWGPWHPRYPKEFWLVLKKGLYVHPGGAPVVRSYGYVKNIVNQIMKILEAPSSLVDKKVYYLGDPPIRLLDWVNGFSMAITGRPTRIVPRWVLRTLAITGTALGVLGVRFPITLSRYHSMTEDYFSPMDATIKDFGPPQYTLEDGIHETVAWLDHYWEMNFLNGQ